MFLKSINSLIYEYFSCFIVCWHFFHKKLTSSFKAIKNENFEIVLANPNPQFKKTTYFQDCGLTISTQSITLMFTDDKLFFKAAYLIRWVLQKFVDFLHSSLVCWQKSTKFTYYTNLLSQTLYRPFQLFSFTSIRVVSLSRMWRNKMIQNPPEGKLNSVADNINVSRTIYAVIAQIFYLLLTPIKAIAFRIFHFSTLEGENTLNIPFNNPVWRS